LQHDVVAHFLDGRIVKGKSMNVAPQRPSTFITVSDGTRSEVSLADLQALYFVRDLKGDPQRTDAADVTEGDVRLRGSNLITIHFQDGEQLVALSNSPTPRGEVFFVLPVDPGSNNVRILINRKAVARIEAATSS